MIEAKLNLFINQINPPLMLTSFSAFPMSRLNAQSEFARFFCEQQICFGLPDLLLFR